ncbi:methionine adenosyltransferase [Candidatus Acidulodesulfobacterium sp. H_13]|uniref:methionine adenosyltransferase n=1 Tax=Candidatus Acidulodesulfobacterium sp. H_13 TaxID=3395470 RepID=UPI003AF496AA
MSNQKGSFIFTSESVTEGHPDKICDKISDSILDDFIAQDKYSRVALETMVTTGLVAVAGEVTSNGTVNYQDIIRNVIKEIGYDDSAIGFDYKSCGIITAVGKQSSDISMGVGREKEEDQGAGDQGLMFGYATSETDDFMPAPIYYAHKLTKRLADVRKAGILDFIRPDGKSQVSVRYINGEPDKITSIVISTQHTDSISQESLKEAVISEIIDKTIPAELIDKDTKFFINPTGRFVIGGPNGDTGLTGRKIIVDTYGGMGRHGGGAFSGKDPSKVDRSGSYMARFIAKNIVGSGIAKKCEVQIAYAIGIAEPVSVMTDTFGTGIHSDDIISAAISRVFSLKPYNMLKALDLLRPIYAKTSNYGHFGRFDDDFTWEKLVKIQELKKAALDLSKVKTFV